MHFLHSLIETTKWFGENFALNLGFIPAEKLAWKPVPTAKCALEITAHAASSLRGMQAAFQSGVYSAELPAPTSLEEAQTQIRSAAHDYAAFLESLSPGDLEGVIELPFGTFPRAFAIEMDVQDLIHHHGQIAYIQTLLGDTEDHFMPIS